MPKLRLYTLIADPRSLKEFADTKPEIAAVGVNAVTGSLLVLAAAVAMAPLFSNTLVVLLGILFGPLVGFLVSSTYPRIELAVGRRMGGKASLDELYRIFAWSFLLIGFASLFYSLLLKLVQNPGIIAGFLLSVPSLALVLLAARSYWSNMIAGHRLTRARGSAVLVITLILFIILIVGCGATVSLLYKYGASENIKAL